MVAVVVGLVGECLRYRDLTAGAEVCGAWSGVVDRESEPGAGSRVGGTRLVDIRFSEAVSSDATRTNLWW